MKSNQKLIWIIVIIVLIILGIVVATRDSADDSGLEEGLTPTLTDKQTQQPSSTTGPGTTRKTPAPKPSLSYEAALVQYKNLRIQFDANCQASPSSFTINNGTNVMFDNRSGDARWISVGGVGYEIAGYGFRIVYIKATTTPHTFPLGCGSAVNVGSILVQ